MKVAIQFAATVPRSGSGVGSAFTQVVDLISVFPGSQLEGKSCMDISGWLFEVFYLSARLCSTKLQTCS